MRDADEGENKAGIEFEQKLFPFIFPTTDPIV